MSNVIHLPPVHRGHAISAADGRAAVAERADALRAVLTDNRPMMREDQVTVAEAIGRLLDRLRRQGIAKAQVLLEANIAKTKEDFDQVARSVCNQPGSAQGEQGNWPAQQEATPIRRHYQRRCEVVRHGSGRGTA